MSRPVVAYHIIFGAYGFWLPNDPRGSQSRYVFAPRLTPFGPPQRLRFDTTLTPADAAQLRAMQAELEFPPVRFSPAQITVIAEGFGTIIGRLGLVFYAAALMPDHVHIVATRQDMHAEDIVGHLKRAASRQLSKAALHPFAGYSRRDQRLPSPWGERGWKVFLFDLDEIEHAVQYVNDNPAEAGLPAQQWPWVKEFEG
jgi:REP element-mobilizing transposase RayT